MPDAKPVEFYLASADPAKGEAVFKKCAACHVVAAGGANGIGPNLWAVMGAPVGKHAPGFAYSEALKGKGGNWDWKAMDDWLASPRAFAPGTKMSSPARSPEARATSSPTSTSRARTCRSRRPSERPEAAPA